MYLKKVVNRFVPMGSYMSLCLWPFVFIRTESAGSYDDVADNHERIHALQQREMLIIFFLLWYSLEWLVKAMKYRSFKVAYRNVSFEREAYAYERDLSYMRDRKRYDWIRFLWKH